MAEFSCRPRQVDGDGAAKRRRLRRLRSWWRHEQQTVAAVLATVTHHSFGKVGTASGVLRNMETATRTGNGEEFEAHYTGKFRKTPPQGSRPAPLPEVAGWQGRLERHVVEQTVVSAPGLQILDAPVPQKVEQLLEVLRRLDIEVPAQVIEVPKISQDSIRERLVDCDLRHPQMAEQLMEVPTVVSYSSLLQRTVEQTVDIPASRGRGRRGGLHVFFPGQSSTAAAVDIPVPRGDLQGFLPGQGSTASSSHSPDAENEAGKGVFRTFPRGKKCSVRSHPESDRARQCQLMDAGGL